MTIRNRKTHDRKPQGARRKSHRRGNVLILVVAVLVLLVLIGTAYIQAARNDRTAASTMNSSNIDAAVDAEIARIASLMKADLISDTGDMLDGRDGGGKKNIGESGYDPFSSREPFDMADPDIDPWLASVTFYDNGGTLYWDNISNVTGKKTNWSIAGNAATLSLGDKPTGYDISGSSEPADRADADGDGIRESRWIDSALGSIRGTRYVAAFRVIDLSALVNINVGLALTNDSGNFANYASNADVPRWWYPSELAVNRLLAQLGANVAERKKLFDYRLGTTGVALPLTWADRYTFWQRGPRQYGNFNDGATTKYVPLGLPEEMKLRHRNGLNNPDTRGTAMDELMPQFIRESGSATTETDYKSVFASPQGYLDGEPRHQMTTVSGATIIAPKLANTPARTLQVDLNNATDQQIRDAIAETYTGASIAVPGGGYASASQFGDQLTACIRDYADADNMVSNVNGRLGFELLPYIAEVYVQSVYHVANAGDVSGSGPFNVKWTKGSTTDGFAIEIRNPYKQSISIKNIKLDVGGTSADLATLAGKDTMNAQETLVLFQNNDKPSGGTDDIKTMVTGSATKKAVALNWPTSASFDVKLAASVEDSTEWDYVVYPSGGAPATIEEPSAGTAPAVNNDERYLQRSSRGTGDGLNVMTVTKADVQTQDIEPTQAGVWQDINKLGEDGKNNPNPVTPITAGQQIVARNDASDLYWQAGEVAQIVVPPLTSGSTMAAAWGDRSLVSDWMLDFDTTEMTDSTDDDFAVPRAVVLMGRLTTLSPLVDGVDNDGDGTADNAEELFVPGRLNLNTVPVETLKKVLPIADPSYRNGLAEIIDAYRRVSKTPSNVAFDFTQANRNRQTGLREDRGFAHIGEVLLAAGPMFGSGPIYSGDGVDNHRLPAGTGPIIDFLSPDASTPDGITDDREERAMALRWLGQVASVRSDVFAAYVTVRGYPKGDLSKTPLEEIRFVAILDRSGIRNADDKVKVLAVMRY